MVYPPSEDSFLLEAEIKKYIESLSEKEKSKLKVLDMGSGSGIQAKAALKAGAKSVLAADINQESIKKLKDEGIKALKSNLFSSIRGKFGVIAFNPPYLPEDKRESGESRLATTGGKKGDEIVIRFLKQAKNHLEKDGIILLVLSSLTPRKRILQLLKENKLSHRVISSEKFFFETLEVWKIFQ